MQKRGPLDVYNWHYNHTVERWLEFEVWVQRGGVEDLDRTASAAGDATGGRSSSSTAGGNSSGTGEDSSSGSGGGTEDGSDGSARNSSTPGECVWKACVLVVALARSQGEARPAMVALQILCTLQTSMT